MAAAVEETAMAATTKATTESQAAGSKEVKDKTVVI